MNEPTQWETACRKLTELTRTGNVKWTSHSDLAHEREQDDDRTIGPIYLAYYADKNIAVYEYRTKVFTDEDDWYWNSGVSIEFVEFQSTSYRTDDREVRCLWRWPEGSGGRALLEAIRYQSSQADEFLNQILSANPA